MPEGHTLHRIAEDHNGWFAGQRLQVESPQGRFAIEADILSGRRLRSVEAFGKHLFYHWAKSHAKSSDPRCTLHIHLGLYGKFRTQPLPLDEPRGAVRVRMVGQQYGFDLNGPNCCELLDQASFKAIVDRIGVDPLRNDADPEQAWKRIYRSRVPIGSLLLNQSVIAGIGNIYRAEILYQLGIHPERSGSSISRDEFDQIWKRTVALMKIGKKHNRIITVPRDQVDKPLSQLTADERLTIYKKSDCDQCGSEVRQWELAARTMYACDHCQN